MLVGNHRGPVYSSRAPLQRTWPKSRTPFSVASDLIRSNTGSFHALGNKQNCPRESGGSQKGKGRFQIGFSPGKTKLGAESRNGVLGGGSHHSSMRNVKARRQVTHDTDSSKLFRGPISSVFEKNRNPDQPVFAAR